MALNKSLALREDRVNFLLLALDLVLPRVGDSPVLLGQDRFQGRDSLGINRDMGFIEGGYEFLGSIHRQIRKIARPILMPSGADQVVELATVAAGAFRELEPPTAAAAGGGADEIVAVVFPGSVTRHPLRRENPLHLVEQVLRNERRVRSLVFHAPEFDDADVIGIPQHLPERRVRNLASGPLRRRTGAKPTTMKLVREGFDGPLAG